MEHGEQEQVEQLRHSCGRLLVVVRPRGIELVCPKCSGKVLYTWKRLLRMMLAMEQPT